MNNPIDIAHKILEKVELLAKMRNMIRDRGTERAHAQAEYDKQLALTIVRLKNGEKIEFEGKAIHNPIGSITEKIAKGITWEYKLKADEKEYMYKSLMSNINAVMAEVSALQSINKHLD